MTSAPWLWQDHAIFVSHSHADDAFGKRLIADLRRALGNDDAVWYDASGGLHGGDAWWATIREQLRARPVFLVIVSPAAMASKWVNNEIDLAWRQRNTSGKTIIPVLYQPAQVRDDLDLLHHISFVVPRDYDVAFAELLDALGIPSAIENPPAVAHEARLPPPPVLAAAPRPSMDAPVAAATAPPAAALLPSPAATPARKPVPAHAPRSARRPRQRLLLAFAAIGLLCLVVVAAIGILAQHLNGGGGLGIGHTPTQTATLSATGTVPSNASFTDLTTLQTVEIAAVNLPTPVNGVNWGWQPRGAHTPNIIIAVGTVVGWDNESDAPHTVESGAPAHPDGLFATSPVLAANSSDTFATTFRTAGTFEYFCGIHPAMVGYIRVRST